jgi:ribulose-phosphate 3-epimerase
LLERDLPIASTGVAVDANQPHVRLAPSILSADFGQLAENVRELDRTGEVDRIHIDVMDGMFVPNLSFGSLIIAAVRRATTLPLDVHLMTVDPGRYYAGYVDSGATSLTVHVEACPHLNRDLTEIRRLGARAGVAINPGTPVGALDAVFGDLDVVLVMSVNPGFGGQKFIGSSLDKLSRVRQRLAEAGSVVDIAVDGGIGPENAREVVDAGATVLIAGSSVFSHPRGLGAGLAALRQAVGG